MRIFWLILSLFLCVPAQAKTYPLGQVINNEQNLGSAVCVANSKKRTYSLFVTVAHNIQNGGAGAKIWSDGRWYPIQNYVAHGQEDLALFEVSGTFEATPLLEDDLIENNDVLVCGYGPYWNKTEEPFQFAATSFHDHLIGHEGYHPVPGDSGGGVFAAYEEGGGVLVGLVQGFEHRAEERVRIKYRYQYRSRKPGIMIIPGRKIRTFIKTQYGSCPTCPQQYIRPQIQQPMIGIGLPVGPPRVVGVTEYNPPDRQPPQKPGSTQADIAAEVARYFQQNSGRFVGPAGPAGPRGPAGPEGSGPTTEELVPIVAQVTQTMLDQDPKTKQLLRRLDELESEVSQLKNRKLTFIQGVRLPDGTIKKGETRVYDMDKPIPIVNTVKDLHKNEQ